MNDGSAMAALAALANVHRLRITRMLVRAGPDGLPAGEIGRRVGLSPSALSFHLAHLQRERLVRAARAGRHIVYAAEFETLRRLLAFLTEDCCQGRPEICGDLAGVARLCGD